ncbi:MAG: hypothetical protein ACE5JQ_04380 [Candidatus Methylomirabilales bacterium]
MAGEGAGPRCRRQDDLWEEDKILLCAVRLNGEYGMKGIFVGVPVKLGRDRVEQMIAIKLTPEERGAFEKSATAERWMVDTLQLL